MIPMRGARRLAAVAFFALTAAAGAQTAPDPAHLQAAREVVELSGASNSFREIVPIFLDEAKRTLVRTNPDLAKDLDAVAKGLVPEFEKRRDQLMSDVAAVYAQTFTTAELADIKTFYQSPAGAKLVASLPSVVQATYDRTQNWTRQLSQDVLTRIREEMKKRGKDI